MPQIGKIDKIVENVDGLGTNLTFQFRMFSDKSYEKPYLEYEYPVDVSVKQRLYFEASVSNANGDKFYAKYPRHRSICKFKRRGQTQLLFCREWVSMMMF